MKSSKILSFVTACPEALVIIAILLSNVDRLELLCYSLKMGRIFSPLEGKYARFFYRSKRATGRSNIAILKSGMLDEFIEEILKDDEIDIQLRHICAISLSGGMRVSEALSLRKNDIFVDEFGEIYFSVKVLKKKDFTERAIRVHPSIVPYLMAYIQHKRGFERIFTITRQTVGRSLKAICEGLTPHSLRHSHVSYLLNETSLKTEQIGKLIKFSNSMVDRYAHVDQLAILRGIF